MDREGAGEDGGAACEPLGCGAAMDVVRGEVRDGSVMMLAVVPVEEVLAECTRIFERAEAFGIGSESTIYRILRAEGPDAHRGRAKSRTVRTVDEHVATAANHVWIWDITYLLSAVGGRFYYLHMVEDVWAAASSASRSTKENPLEASAALMQKTCAAERVDPESLLLHSDNGGPMKGLTMDDCHPCRRRRLLRLDGLDDH